MPLLKQGHLELVAQDNAQMTQHCKISNIVLNIYLVNHCIRHFLKLPYFLIIGLCFIVGAFGGGKACNRYFNALRDFMLHHYREGKKYTAYKD